MLPASLSELDALLTDSSASDEFKTDVLRFFTDGTSDRLRVRGHAPRLKIGRVLKQVLAHHPELDIQAIALTAQSGCSDFTGTVEVETSTATKVFNFHWCCRWRAEQEGWTDYFGFPDQMRAAREFDWRCFRVWQEHAPNSVERQRDEEGTATAGRRSVN
ncbi:MAG TPA: hypothetical protein VIV65_06070 [Gemmatimonadaceae bacterium]